MISTRLAKIKIRHVLAVLFLILIAYFGLYKLREEHSDIQVIYYTSNSFGEIWVYHTRDLRCLSFEKPTSKTIRQSCIYFKDVETPCDNYYRKVLGALYLNPFPRNILMLGLGGGATVKYLRTVVPAESQFDIVEINPNLIPISKEFFFLEETDKTKIFVGDAYQYVRNAFNANKYYDVIVVDVIDDYNAPMQLLSPSFMKTLKGITSPQGGVLVVNTLDHATTSVEDAKLVFGTFGYFYHLKGDNNVIMASNGDLPSLQLIQRNAKKFHEKFKKLKIDEEWLLSQFVVYSRDLVG